MSVSTALIANGVLAALVLAALAALFRPAFLVKARSASHVAPLVELPAPSRADEQAA